MVLLVYFRAHSSHAIALLSAYQYEKMSHILSLLLGEKGIVVFDRYFIMR